MIDLYDPLTYENLMLGLTSRFQDLALTPLNAKSDIQRVEGPRIYSLHYGGDFTPYEPIAAQQDRPIYVGKAVPPGSRKGKAPNPSAPQLRRRITEHAKSIDQAQNLQAEDFSFRALAVEPVWITLAERFLIDHFRPCGTYASMASATTTPAAEDTKANEAGGTPSTPDAPGLGTYES